MMSICVTSLEIGKGLNVKAELIINNIIIINPFLQKQRKTFSIHILCVETLIQETS